MRNRIAIIDGHPDADRHHFIHALADSYGDGAEAAGHEVRRIDVAALDFPVLRSRHAWADEPPPEAIRTAQDTIGWADHLAFFYPLWLGDVPALLKAFLEQVMRPGFAIGEGADLRKAGLLKGKSAHVVVTMGMPAFFYRFYYGAHSVRSFERNILKFAGIAPIGRTLIGDVEANADERAGWLDEMYGLGESVG